MSFIDLTELQSEDFSVLMHYDLAGLIQRFLPLDIEIEDVYCEILRHAKWAICVGVFRTRQIVNVIIGFNFLGTQFVLKSTSPRVGSCWMSRRMLNELLF